MSEQFSKIESIEAQDDSLNRKMNRNSGTLATGMAYGAAILAITILSAIFAQNLGRVFEDPTMKAVSYAAAIAVGGSSIIFLVFRDKLLKSKQQFTAACIFVAVELALLTLGALFAFGSAWGWEFPPFMEWAERIAIVATLPIVAAEWIVVKALDPVSIANRARVQTDAQVNDSENKARKAAKLSNAVITIREQGTLAAVIGEELARLPASQRPYFLNLIMANNGDELKDVQEVLQNLMGNSIMAPQAGTPQFPPDLVSPPETVIIDPPAHQRIPKA